jgi:hypothetical protein
MSTAFAIDPVRRPVPTTPHQTVPAFAPAPAAAPLRAVRPYRRPRLLAASAVVAGIGCVLAAQLLLSVAAADGAFRLADLKAQSAELDRQQEVRTEQLRALAAPQRLAAEASSLGMVPDDSPAYLDATTGRVLGSTAPTR